MHHIIELECFSTYFQKKITNLRLEDIFRLKQSFSIHFLTCKSESSNISLVTILNHLKTKAKPEPFP